MIYVGSTLTARSFNLKGFSENQSIKTNAKLQYCKCSKTAADQKMHLSTSNESNSYFFVQLIDRVSANLINKFQARRLEIIKYNYNFFFRWTSASFP